MRAAKGESTAQKRARLDVALVERGLVETRSQAQSLIMARRVLVNGRFVDKPGTSIHADDALHITELEHPWVGRGGMKLAHALEHFQIDVGRGEVGKGGIIRDAAKRAAAVQSVVDFAKEIGFDVRGVIESPVKGAEGNVEYLMHAKFQISNCK